ncbi:MAG: hypothetical protein FWE61_10535, partial [Micrococcales bacterium]|nr:hypothetical protein [Micrococcales bacterium]
MQPDVGQAQREELWESLRQGSRNVAGVTWQLAVSAHVWVMARVGDLPFVRFVPEGLEDLDCYGRDGTETLVQMKEVGAGAGRLTAAGVGDVIMHAMRSTGGDIVVVTDGKLGSGLDFTGWGATLGDRPGAGAQAVAARLEHLGVESVQARSVLGRVRLVRLPWDVRGLTEALVTERLGLHPTVASLVVGSAYESMAGAGSDQRHRAAADARELGLGDFDTIVAEVQSSVDVSGLDEAVAAGVCRPADYLTPASTTAEQFYLGIDGAPAHVAASFDTVRLDEMDQIVQAARDERYAL